jgi:hypothetical protein
MKTFNTHSDPFDGQVKWLVGAAFIAIVLAGLILLPR